MYFWESTVWLIYCVSIVSIICLIFSIKQINIRFKQSLYNKKQRKELEKLKQEQDKQYFNKLDKILASKNKK